MYQEISYPYGHITNHGGPRCDDDANAMSHFIGVPSKLSKFVPVALWLVITLSKEIITAKTTWTLYIYTLPAKSMEYFEAQWKHS